MTRHRTIHINSERTWRGGEKQTLLLVKGLVERGHEAEIVCPPGSPLAERAAAAGIAVHPLSMRGEADLFAVTRLRRLFRREGFDICQMHTSHAHALGVLARGFLDRPLTVVNRRVDFSIHRRGLLGLNRFKYRYGVDCYIAISHAIRRVMVSDGVDAERIEVVHSGVGAQAPAAIPRAALRRQWGLEDDAYVVGTVAHFADHKGLIHLIHALGRLRKRYPRLRSVLVGDGEQRADLERAIAGLDLAKITRITGFQQDIGSYLGIFDLFVMPSLMEGLCTSILDALLANLPVVASRAGGIPEIIEHERTGLLVPPGNPEELAAAIARMIDEPGLARELGARGRELATSEYSIDRMVSGTLAVYDRLRARDPLGARKG